MKKILLLSILLFQMTIVFAQSIGTIVKSKTIYSGSGLNISYTISYYGNGDCNDNPNPYYKKYRVDFSASNTSNATISLYGSRIDLDDNLNHFQDNCYTAAAILLGSYPKFEEFGILVPNENRNATMYVYMLASKNELPFVTASIIPNIQKEQQTPNPQQSTSNQNTNNSSQNNYNNQFIQQALLEFNQLLPKVPDGTTKTNIYNDVQNVLNGNYSEQGKLNVLNDAILKFKNLIEQGNSKTSNSNNFKDLQNRQLELVKQIKAIEPNANVWVYEGNIGENETISIQRSKENINHLEKWLERIKPNSNNSLNELSIQNQNNRIGNQNVNISNQQSELSKVEQRLKEQNIESQRQDAQRNQAITELNNQITNSISTINNITSIDKEYVNKMQDFEMIKLAETDPEFNTINSPDDYNLVSLTTNRNLSTLQKSGQIEIGKWATSVFTELSVTKERALKRAKVEAAFMGANTVDVKAMNISTVKNGFYSFPKVDIFAFAYTDKTFNFDVINKIIQKDNSYQITHIYAFDYKKTIDVDDSDYEKKEFKKSITIQSITQNTKDKSINIEALIEGSKNSLSYKLTSCTEEKFILMYREDSKKKIEYKSYLVKLK